jgi:hypothetical protein
LTCAWENGWSPSELADGVDTKLGVMIIGIVAHELKRGALSLTGQGDEQQPIAGY